MPILNFANRPFGLTQPVSNEDIYKIMAGVGAPQGTQPILAPVNLDDPLGLSQRFPGAMNVMRPSPTMQTLPVPPQSAPGASEMPMPQPTQSQPDEVAQLMARNGGFMSRLANGLMAAGSKDPAATIQALQAQDQAAVENARKRQMEQKQLDQASRKLTLDELKARKPTIQSSGQPGYAIAIYPDGRVEFIKDDAAVQAYRDQEQRKDDRAAARDQAMVERTQMTIEAQNQRNAENIAAQNARADSRNNAMLQGIMARIGASDAKDARKGSKLNPTLQKAEDADFELIDTAQGVVKQISPVVEQLRSGSLNLGVFRNAYNASRNLFGKSTPESQAFANMEATIEKIRNDSLRLNKGVQTEGDAQRAINELTAAFAKNDNAVMAQALERLQEINAVAAKNKAAGIDRRRTSQGVEPMFGNQSAIDPVTKVAPANTGATSGTTKSGVKYTIEGK